ncbi:MAG: Hsp70 family protein [Myxococcales bacterium]|nr:Hsp70 family protein [Myxococcales bacterium]
MRLGVDFGTTRTVVAAALEGRYPVATFSRGEWLGDYVPSLACLDAEGELRFGLEAAALESPQLCLPSMKRVLSAFAPDEEIPDLGVSALALLTGYLEALRRALLESSNLPLRAGEALEAMVAVPANASSRQRFLTLEAFARAGFEVVGMLNEPTAAALEFARQSPNALSPRSPKRYVVIYDLGGGTFDTAAISLEGRRFSLLSSEGISRLGGHDFDAHLLALALEGLGLPERSLSQATHGRCLERCREAKESLHASSRRILVDLSAELGREPLVIDLDGYYDRCLPLIERTVERVEHLFAALGAHGLDPSDARQLGALYVVGGAAAFPPVARLLRRRFARKLQLAPQGHAATAVGLAIAADPEADVLVREATTRHFGVWREGEGGREKRFDPLLRKGDLPAAGEPLEVRRRYRPRHSIGHLRFLECSALGAQGQPDGELCPWGELRFPYDPALLDHPELDALPIEEGDRGALIEETYRYDPDGTISVEIENRTHGYRRRFHLEARLPPLGAPAERRSGR